MKIKAALFIIFVSVLAADIITKTAIKANVGYMESITVIDGFFNIVYVLNPGAAFGFLREMDDSYRRIFFIVVVLAAITGIFILMIKEKCFWASAAYSLVLAGAAGNLMDRIRTGLVVDFLDFHIGQYHWPAFNVADISITAGIGMLVIDAVFFHKRRKA